MAKQKQRHEIEVRPELDREFYSIAYDDYIRFCSEIKLAATPRHSQLLAAQSVHGHAMNGDWCFTRDYGGEIVHLQYVNATIPDVYAAITSNDPSFAKQVRPETQNNPTIDNLVEDIKLERHLVIKEAKEWAKAAIRGKKGVYNPTRLLDSSQQPIMGIEYFRHMLEDIRNPEDVLKGIYLGSYLDSGEWREQAEDYFRTVHKMDFSIHRGICTAGNLRKIKEAGLSIAQLSNLTEYDQKAYSLKRLKEMGVIVDFEKEGTKAKKEGVPYKNPYVPVYVELKRGYGVSDDAAFNFISLMYGEDAGLGFIIADAIDTLDKCTTYIKEKGEDEAFGDMIRNEYIKKRGIESALGITDEDITHMIFAASIDSKNPGVWPSCSQRRFLQLDSGGDYALRTHIRHIRHYTNGSEWPSQIKLSINQVPSDKFFYAFKERVSFMITAGLINLDILNRRNRLKRFMIPNQD
jgi:hypothetical protein